MDDRPACRSPPAHPRKPNTVQVEFFNEDIDHSNRIVFGYVVFQAVGQQRRLPPILALNEPLHPAP